MENVHYKLESNFSYILCILGIHTKNGDNSVLIGDIFCTKCEDKNSMCKLMSGTIWSSETCSMIFFADIKSNICLGRVQFSFGQTIQIQSNGDKISESNQVSNQT